MTWNEDDIWFAVIGESSYDDYPVVAGTERQFEHPRATTDVSTIQLSEPHTDIHGEAYLAIWNDPMFHDKARVIGKTRLQAFAGMCRVFEYVDGRKTDGTLSDRYDL